jgi:hypothetical protein
MDMWMVSLLAFSLSSAWLYSPGIIGWFREYWIKFWGSKNSPLQYLGICQLCSGFWFAFLANLTVVPYYNITLLVVYSLIGAAISWSFGSLTNAFIWLAAVLEKWSNIQDERK